LREHLKETLTKNLEGSDIAETIQVNAKSWPCKLSFFTTALRCMNQDLKTLHPGGVKSRRVGAVQSNPLYLLLLLLWTAESRVASWFIFKLKIPIWVYFWGPYIGKCWYILWTLRIFYKHFGNLVTIWYISCWWGTFFRFWNHAPRKIWQPWPKVPRCRRSLGKVRPLS
jgi:hypothetical protein